MSARRSLSVVGVALDESGLVLATSRDGAERVERHDWDRDAFCAAVAREDREAMVACLAPAFAAARRASPRAPSLAVALMPPLVQVRLVELPPLRPEEARDVLTRDVSRYFLPAQGAQAVSVVPPRGRGDASLAAAASDALLDALQREARDAGWPRVAIVPAHAAWSASSPDADAIVLAEPGATTVLRLARGVPVGLRRVRGDDADRVAAAVGTGAQLVVAGTDDATRSLATSLQSRLEAARLERVVVPDSATLAARHAAQATVLHLQSHGTRAARLDRARGSTRALLGAAALFVVIAAGAQLWGEHRELAAIRAERARLAGRVERALAQRNALLTREERARTIATIAAETPAWSTVVARLAIELPRSAHLVSLRASADSIVLEGYAASAAGVVQALRKAPAVAEVRPLAPYRRERIASDAGDSELERFSVAVRLVPAPREGR